MARARRRRPPPTPGLVSRRARAPRALRLVYLAIVLGMVVCLVVSLLPQCFPPGAFAP
ncbi:MAG: hypothetical protein KatS3mg061_0073 [Dehalococcoidia bacterium]|nr:MAG: hypothetical protein KatS3mg061_0073 [Dehalococcoidia bacterium]